VNDELNVAVLGDPSRIRQILANFISNAIKFTEKGEVCIRASCADEDDGKHCRMRFSVTDTGIGVDEKARKALFTPFMQADTSITRRFGGTGLGLAICKKLVELMDGSIGVEKAFPQGSVFWFELRCEKVTDVFAARTQKPLTNVDREKPASPPVTASCHVLLAEDNIINQHLATAVLTRLGCTFDVVQNGQEALDAVAENNYALVLMDGMMPVMDGYVATQRIRLREETQKLPRLPVVALTASATTDDALRCMQAGMDDHLSKPYTMDGLRGIIEKWGKPQPQA
jgi:CheY-like chemotaxis protein